MIPRRDSLGGAEEPCLADVCVAADADDPYARARSALLVEIKDDLRDTASSTGSDRFDAVVLATAHRPRAVDPQPFIVALTTQLSGPRPTGRLLEVGTGSGYQAAVLARLVGRVHTIEIVRPLGEHAVAVVASD